MAKGPVRTQHTSPINKERGAVPQSHRRAMSREEMDTVAKGLRIESLTDPELVYCMLLAMRSHQWALHLAT